MTIWIVIGAALLAAGAALVAYRLGYSQALTREEEKIQAARREAQEIVARAEAREREILETARKEGREIRQEAEAVARKIRESLERMEARLQRKEEALDRKLERVERQEQRLHQKERELQQLEVRLQELEERKLRELERIAELDRETARAELIAAVEREAREDMARVLRQVEEELKEQADEKARWLIAQAIQRSAYNYVADLTVSVVELPNDEMKGRIIGREGRNIRLFERLTGVDLIVDDTPEVVTLSCHDPVRREIARLALSWLVKDGRIHPARIEEAVEKARQEVERIMKREAEQVVQEAGVPPLPAEVMRLLGRLRFRTSYGQNILQHSLECARLAAVMAAELHADVQVAKVGALLHDIGKAVDHDVQGPHALIGAEILRRNNLPEAVVHAVAAHHFEEEPRTPEAFIVAAVDAISGARPGARRDTLEQYIKRLEALEAVARSFEGVEKAYAIQAGREVRIMVKPEAVDDLGAIQLARGIARKIEESLQYPGQIKVTVIRETKAVDYAR